MNLDLALVAQARDLLGTSSATETVHRALIEVINLRHRRRQLQTEFPGLTLESLEELRQNDSSLPSAYNEAFKRSPS